ncbi:MAG: tyrosine--tRNA ligase [Nitrososphaerota archaeon]|nr:tyrosine--tRNA ligase [Nitrososphaerales archaeon]MCX8191469.1 tyrosine--tRNA ligase [Nitrososphaerales archaeon]MDW8044921.1 tyrosine--tRNA ligase [Nitrososphaerota archaeon]
MDINTKIELVLKAPTEEVITLEDLKTLFETTTHPKHYIGLELSGPLHLGSLIVSGLKINDFLKAGVRCTVFLADWHSYINNKLGGDWERIRRAAKYYSEAFLYFCPGCEIVLGSDLYRGNDEYWANLIRFSKQITLARNVRCLTIMGRSEKEKLDFAQYIYPIMQSVDIKALNVDIAHSGMDQRKVHVLAREVYPKLGWKPPIAIHHSLLPGLSEPVSMGLDEDPRSDLIVSSKMSKSKPWTCIFIHDSKDEIKRKLRRAWCPEGVVENNPVLEIARCIIFHEYEALHVDRPSKYGGPITFNSYKELEDAYRKREIHPADLKEAVSEEIDKIIAPIRGYFENKKELLEVFKLSEE